MEKLQPKVQEAYEKYSLARLNLLQAGVLATNADVAKMRQIRAEIDQAVNLQTLLKGADWLAAFPAKFI